MKQLTTYLILVTVLLLASCGTPKKVAVSTPPPPPPPPAGVEVNNTSTKVFERLLLPNNNNWVLKNEDGTATADEYLVKKMDDWRQIAIIRTMSWGSWKSGLKDTTAAMERIEITNTQLLQYNDFHFKSPIDNNIPFALNKTKIVTLDNGVKAVLIESEVKITNEASKAFGNSYYARNYFFLAKKDEDKARFPIISSATLLTPENYESEKKKFIELVDYVVNTAILLPDYNLY